MRAAHRFIFAACVLATVLGPVTAQDQPKPNPDPSKPVAGKADVLKHVRKKFATLLEADPAALKVRLRIEGEDGETTWPVLPDAEVKIHGWWGRIDQLRPLDRLWVWFAVDRDKNPRTLLMIADEMSEQDIHGQPLTIKAAAGGKLTLHVPDEEKVPLRELAVGETYAGPREVGAQIYAQSSGGTLREAATPREFESLRRTQQELLRERWRTSGLPGTVTALHPLGGEMEVLLDHEAMRWGRHLQHGDQVTLRTERPIKATVHTVRTWRERTQLRLVTESGLDQMDLALGQRLAVLVPEPP